MAFPSFSQKEKSLLRKGNKAYENNEYDKASEAYQKSLEADGSYGKASFNLGNSNYRMGSLGEAAKQFEVAAADAIEKPDKAKAYHNIGTSFLNAARMLMENPPEANDSVQPPDPQQLIQVSIEAYKNALRNNPKDEESRYNLAYAKELLQEGGGGGGQDQQEQEQEQNEDQEDQDKGDKGDKEEEKKEGEDGEDGKENEKNDKGDEEQDKGEEKPKEDQMSKEEAEQLLKALDKNEKDLQKKLGKERAQGEKIKIDKDW